jgi:hypothetical protein
VVRPPLSEVPVDTTTTTVQPFRSLRSHKGAAVIHLIVMTPDDWKSVHYVRTALCGQKLRTGIVGSKYDADKPKCPKCVAAHWGWPVAK